VKRPDGFDERPEEPAARPADAADRARRTPRRPLGVGLRAALGAATGREARSASDTSATDDAPGTTTPPARTTGTRPGAGPDRLSDLPDLPDLPDVDLADDGAGAGAGAGTGAPGRDADDHLATVTDVIDVDRASRPTAERAGRTRPDGADATPDADAAHQTPIGVRVRAAETAREARVARKRRRLLERAEVRRFTRRSRHRRTAWLAAGGVVLVLAVSILVAVYSPLMALRTIEVKGADRVDAAELRRALSGQLGTPLARIDLGEVKQQIAAFPLIESYVTEEEPPDRLVVTVTERTPVVAVQSGKSFDLVDPAGIVVQSTAERPDGMPVADVRTTQLGSPVFRTMTEVVLALPSAVRSQVAGIAASTTDDVTLTMGDGSRVVWGSPDDSADKAALLDALVKDHAARSPDTKVEYDVSAPDNGIIRSQS
jgi:cell division septal protein FtsQ